MLGMQVRDLLLKGLPEGALEEGRRPQNYVQEDPGAPPQNGRRREWVVGECCWGRRGVEKKLVEKAVIAELLIQGVHGTRYSTYTTLFLFLYIIL